MNHYHLISQIKNQVESKKQIKYQQIKSKKNQKYYELYLSSVIFIQRQWRKHLVLQYKRLEKKTLKSIEIFNQSQTKNQELRTRLQKLRVKKQELQNINPNIKIQNLKLNLQNQLRNSVQNVFQRADKYAKVNAVLRSETISYKKINNQNEGLKSKFQKAALQNSVLQHKNKKLTQKIIGLKHTITADKTEIMLLKQQYLSY